MGKHRLGSTCFADSSRDWEGERLIGGDETEGILDMATVGFQADQGSGTRQRSKVRKSFEDPILGYRCLSSI